MRQPTKGMNIKHIMTTYQVSRATAYRAKDAGYLNVEDGHGLSASHGTPKRATPKGFGLPEKVCHQIAKLSARYVVGRQRIWNGRRWLQDSDLMQEAYQAAMVDLWTSGASSEALAFRIGRNAALNALAGWRKKQMAHLDDWLEGYEADGKGSLDMGDIDD